MRPTSPAWVFASCVLLHTGGVKGGPQVGGSERGAKYCTVCTGETNEAETQARGSPGGIRILGSHPFL